MKKSNDFIDYTIPAWAICPMEYGEDSDLNSREIDSVDYLYEKIELDAIANWGTSNHSIEWLNIDCPEFSYYHDMPGFESQGCDCVTMRVHKI